MRFPIRSILMLALTVALSGCLEKLSHPRIEVTGGTFFTPKGEFSIETFSNAGKGEIPNWFEQEKGEYEAKIYLQSNDNSTYLSMGVLPQSRNISLIFELGEDGKELILGDGFYFLNGEKTDLLITKYKKTLVPQRSYLQHLGQQFIFYNLPKPLARLDTTIQGGGIKTATINKIRNGENDTHRFQISFSLNEDKYVIDVSFHVKSWTKWTMGFPGTGP